jgi:predicted ABC-type ATPase
MAEPTPRVIVLAGPNGAGKTTAARSLLADTLHLMTFVNADVIAQGLAAFDPDSAAVEASRLMLERLHALADQRADFAFETTLAARSLAGWLHHLRQTGYAVHLVYFWLESADLAVARVAQRVRMGGHAIPEETIHRRYSRSAENLFRLYCPLVSTWRVYDNSGAEMYQLVAEGDAARQTLIHDEVRWRRIQGVSKP